MVYYHLFISTISSIIVIILLLLPLLLLFLLLYILRVSNHSIKYTINTSSYRQSALLITILSAFTEKS